MSTASLERYGPPVDASPVRLQPPPKPVLVVLNPVLRRLLRSPLAPRLPAPMAVLEYTGRRSGRAYATCVGVHELAGGPVVFTEAPWRHNFAGGREVAVRRGSRRRTGRGVLVEDPEAVLDALEQAVQRVGPRGLAIAAPRGHVVTREDLRRLDRKLVRLELDG